MANAIEIGKVGEVDEEFDITAPGVVEDLTRQGRMITFQDGVLGGEGEVTLVWIPPEGVSFGDKAYDLYQGGYEFFSGNSSLGITDMVSVSKKEGDKLRERRQKQVELIGRDKPYWYEYVSPEEYRELTKDREHTYAGAEEWGF